jgi:putative nucleotidyltransferase with HDIG domain
MNRKPDVGPGFAVPQVVEASLLVAELFGPDSHRYHHMRGAARFAGEAARLVAPEDADLVTAAVWLHDIGYAVPHHGFHSVDGAEYLLRAGWPPRLAALVAHHSFAAVVAPAAGMTEALARFPNEGGLLADLVVYGDMAVDADGRPVSLEERFTGIRERHPFGTPNGLVQVQRERLIVEAVTRVERALDHALRVAVPA